MSKCIDFYNDLDNREKAISIALKDLDINTDEEREKAIADHAETIGDIEADLDYQDDIEETDRMLEDSIKNDILRGIK